MEVNPIGAQTSWDFKKVKLAQHKDAFAKGMLYYLRKGVLPQSVRHGLVDEDSDYDDEEEADPRERERRQKFGMGGPNRLKLEDFIETWWRDQDRGTDWADPFCAVLDIVTIVQVNSAIVERLWSMYNAMFNAQATDSGFRHRELSIKVRFDEHHR